MSAHPTFPTANGKYHGIGTLSLLCSEWEEVGHARMKHRHQKTVVVLLLLLYFSGTRPRVLARRSISAAYAASDSPSKHKSSSNTPLSF